MTEQLGELRAALIPSAEEAAKMQQAYARADGSGSYLLSNAACKEASRSTFIVDQHALPRSNAVVFAPRFRDAFPEGAFGDELARQASHLMNPDKLDTLIKRVHEMACMPTVFKACTTLHEAWPRKDGVWALRTTLRWDISAARLPATDATAHHFAAPAAALFTVDYRIIPGLLKSAPLNVYCTKAEVVFASATAPSATSEAAT